MSSIRHLVQLVEARIDAGELELPVFPSSAQEVMTLCDSSNVDFNKLANVIRRDATLAGHFLGLANSAAFGARVPLVSLQQALTRLGTTQTKQIALIIACKTRAFVVPNRPERANELIAHALETALYAQEIARARRLNVEEGFLAGLLHDIGRPAVLQLCVELEKETNTKFGEDEMEACADRFHGQVGGLIAARWEMRNAVAKIIEQHHHALTGDETTKLNGVAIVQLADVLTHGERDVAAHPATNLLNLYPEDIDRVVARVQSLSQKEAA